MKKYCFMAVGVCVYLASIGWGGNSDIAIAKPVSAPDKNLESMLWLVGSWEGEAFGGVCEEIWSPPSAETMTGTFKLSVQGQVQFYELMILKIEVDGPTLHLKHFNPDMTGWEEKDKVITFPFVSMSSNELRLDGLVYRKTASDSLLIEVTMKDSDGNSSTEVIKCWRKNGKGERVMSQVQQECRMDYIEFPTINIKDIKNFYSAVFNWKFTDYGPEYTSFIDGRIGGGFALVKEITTGGPLIVIYTTKLEDIQANIRENGGRITRDTFEFPGGKRFHFTDPSGNELAVWSDQ